MRSIGYNAKLVASEAATPITPLTAGWSCCVAQPCFSACMFCFNNKRRNLLRQVCILSSHEGWEEKRGATEGTPRTSSQSTCYNKIEAQACLSSPGPRSAGLLQTAADGNIIRQPLKTASGSNSPFGSLEKGFASLLGGANVLTSIL